MSVDVVGPEEMADEDSGSGRRETKSLNGKHSKFVVCLLFLQYLLHLVQAF